MEYLVNVTVNLINDPPSFAKADKVRDPLTAPSDLPRSEVLTLVQGPHCLGQLTLAT